MPERNSYTPGTPSWTDLSTTDPAAAQQFYAALFGWEYEENAHPDGGPSYIMANKRGRAAAGMMEQQPEQAKMGIPPMWNSYVTVDSVDETTAGVEAAGGSVMMPGMDVDEAGRMSVVADPTGAVICLWEGNEHVGAGVVNEHGSLTWNELQTVDPAAALPFYQQLFGWTAQSMDMGAAGEYTVFNLGEDGIAGCAKPQTPGVPNHWSTVFSVDDADACAASAKAGGGTVLVEPMDVPVGRFAVIADPQGAVFQVMQPAPDA